MAVDEGASRAKWDAMTDEEFVAALVEKHGLEAARAMAKAMALPPPKKGHKPWRRDRVGAKPVKRRALGQNLVPKQGVSWRERGNNLNWPDGYEGPRNRSGLPKSGAPVPPRRERAS